MPPSLIDATRTAEQRSALISGAVENARRLSQMLNGLNIVADALAEIAPLDGYLLQLKRQISEAEDTMRKRNIQAAAAETGRDTRIAECNAVIAQAREAQREAEADHANAIGHLREEMAALEAEHATASANLDRVKAQLRQLATHGE